MSDLCRSLSGFEFSVLTSSRGHRGVVDHVGGVQVVRAPEYARPCSTPVAPGWWRHLRRHDADLVHLHLPNPFAEMAVLTGAAPTPMVASYYAEIMRNPAVARGYGPVHERFLRRMDRIVVSSPALALRATPLRAHRDRMVVIPFGVDPAEWPADDRAVARIRAGHPGPIVLFVGRLVWYKGVDVLIEAMTSVEGTLLVVGDGPERTRLEALARRRVGPRVRFMGEVPDSERASYQRAADLFVLPSTSRAETFGIAMLEAMSVGTPVVSTEVGTGTSWVNRSGETGLVVPPGDPRALAGAITSVLGDGDRRRRLGVGAVRRAQDHFPKAVMLAAFADLYRSLAPSSGRPRPEQAVRPAAER